MKFFFVLFLLLSACGNPFHANDTYIDSEFIPYLKKYQSYKEQYLGTSNVSQIDIIFFSLEYNKMGSCKIFPDGKKLIKIDPVYWFYSNSDDFKELLLFHELGHCDLDLYHHDRRSIMEQYLPNTTDYILYKEYYLKELFGIEQTRDF